MRRLFMFLLLVSFQIVNTLDCYVTNFDSLETLNVTNEAVVTDCLRYTMQHHAANPKLYLPFNGELDLRCYTIGIRAKSELENQTTDMDFDVKLCAYKDTCDVFFERVQMSPLALTGTVTCFECYGDLCNSDLEGEITSDIAFQSTQTSYRRNLYIGAGGCGGLGVVGAVLRLLCCRKRKNTRSIKV